MISASILRFSSSWIFCFPLFTRHLFVGSHCYGYSSDKRLWLLLPGLGLAACLALVVDLPLRFPCCSILGSCHPTLVVFAASKFNRNLVVSITSAIRPVKVLAAASRSGFGGWSTFGP